MPGQPDFPCKVHLDDGAQPVIDAVDDQIASGQFGLNVCNGTAVLQNARTGAP